MPENTPNYSFQQSGGISNVGNQAVHSDATATAQFPTPEPATGKPA